MLRFNLNLGAIAALAMLVAPSASNAEAAYEVVPDEVQIERNTIEAAENALGETESLATSISFAFDYLTTFVSEAHPPDFLTHAELKATTDRLDGVRSIILIDEDGTIQHDAFSFPAPQINIAEREYFQRALGTSGLVIGEGVVGRTSGIPFVPISIYKPALKSVLTAVVDPRKLREALGRCRGSSASCGGAVLTNSGRVVASSPPEVTIPAEVINNILATDERQGTFLYERPNLKALIAFRKSERFPVIVFASYAIASDSVFATQ